MARSELTRSQRQYAHVQNALAQRLADELKCAKGVPFPDFIEPMQPTLVPIPPSGDMWLHEIKYDGYRVQVQVQQNGVHFLTRRGHDWTDRFKALAVAASGLKTYAAVLDGEVIVPGPNGTSDFGALQEDLGAKRSDRMVFCAFDVLYLDGLDLRSCPLEDRKRVLAALLKGVNAPIAYSEHLKGIGKDIVRRACGLELEGIVSKRRDARYQSGRRTEWLKMTCRQRDTFPVVGYALKNGRFDGIYLGRREDRGLVYAGKVEQGFTDEIAKSFVARAEPPLLTRTQPLTNKIRKPKAQWLKPSLLADVEYRALTGERKLRHPSFKGLREDLMQRKASRHRALRRRRT